MCMRAFFMHFAPRIGRFVALRSPVPAAVDIVSPPDIEENAMNSIQTTQRRSKGLVAPVILILVGIVLLLERSGAIDRHTVWQLLPLMPMAFGVSMLAARLRRRAG